MPNNNDFTPTIIDIEASGFGRGSYPIEVGVALPDGTCHCFLIKPHEAWTHWSEEGEQTHHISREVLQDQGRDLTEVTDELNLILDGYTVYSDGWGYDNGWIALLFDTAQRLQKFKVAQLQDLFNEQQYETWHQTHSEVIKEFKISRHRASSDAYLIQQTYLRSRT